MRGAIKYKYQKQHTQKQHIKTETKHIQKHVSNILAIPQTGSKRIPNECPTGPKDDFS